MTSSMREYRRLRRAVAIFLATYFVAGLGTLLLPAREVFPIYSWFLFALVPQNTERYELRLLEVDGVKLDPPRAFQSADGLVDAPHSVAVYQLTQNIGTTNDPAARLLLEQNWLPPRTHYEIVRVSPSP